MADKNLFTQLGKGTELVDFKLSILPLFDKLLNKADIVDPVKLQKIARLRATIDITLKDI